MKTRTDSIAAVRILPEDVANKIAAGEVVERPASVVKELLENALDAGATRISVRLVGAGRRLIEVIDNGHGMSEQNALLAIERHATSKIRKAEDLDAVATMGFRGEALPSIAAVSQFELVTRRAKDDHATRIRIDGGVLRDVGKVGAPPGTRVSVNRLYFNTPVRAKFLKGVTTELSHAIDAVQRHALARTGVGFQLYHNEKLLLDVPEQATLRERAALIWGLSFVRDMIDLEGDQAGFAVRGLIGLPGLTRAARSHQFFFINTRPIVNRSLQYGFEDAYRGLVTVGRHPIGIVLFETHPRMVDVNIHPSKREVRFRDDRVVRGLVRDIVRAQLASVQPIEEVQDEPADVSPQRDFVVDFETTSHERPVQVPETIPVLPQEKVRGQDAPTATISRGTPVQPAPPTTDAAAHREAIREWAGDVQQDLPDGDDDAAKAVAPDAVYRPLVESLPDAPLQLFDTYLLVPTRDRLLIIDQHALHERLNYDNLVAELSDRDYESQQLVVPLVFDVAPAQVKLLETHLDLFRGIGVEIEPFGGNSFQITAVCHLYEESKVPDLVFRVLDEIGQGDLFERHDVLSDMLRLATQACRQSVRAGERLTARERQALLEGFRRLRPPYTCPHGRPIITELTQRQMEKSFRRIQ
ncbi:MAG TPA: DNA mismatch repair endonuclease MutL [Candidatus Hydrogenedentes bacterium]|nr:DNA mismatch repair endonuclease MutL [Candidatus Hydrogenedentota bacterium]